MTNYQTRPMMLKALFSLLLLSMGSCTTGVRQTETREYELQGPLGSSQRTQVLVLGTQHLRVLGDAFSPSLLSALLDGLQKFEPEVIAVEALPPGEIDRLARSATDSTGPLGQILAAFAGDRVRYGQEAQAVLGLTYEEAAAAADSTLHAGASASPEARRLLTLRLLAAYDLASSLLQWSYLSAEDRVSDGVVSREIADFLSRRLNSNNERVTIGVALARRLNLQMLASIDDHVDDEVGLATGLNEELMREVEGTAAFAEFRNSSYFEEAERLLSDAAATGDLQSLYLRINSPDYLNKDVEAQWHLFYRTRLESQLDRARAALWEARNLSIASQIRQASAFHSGGHVLVVIGAAHKPFLDQYLGQMMDVDVVQLAAILERK